MKPWLVRLAVAAILPCGFGYVHAAPVTKTHLEIKDGWYYVNGQKFFLNAIGYEIGARPGQNPYEHRISDLAQIENDLKIIRAAGFNGIRTWSELTDDELRVVQKSGLKIVFGIALKQDEDFSDPKVVAQDLELVKHVLSYSKKYDCIVTYLIMNEPMPEHIRKVGAQATVDLWTKVRDLIHQEHPGIPVTISGNEAITEFVNMNLFDVYAFNAYDYGQGVNFTHGLTNANRFLAEWDGRGKPLILTEFGRSVSRKGSDLYGGNTLDEQMKALTKYYRDLLDAGAVGACPFYYADGWWKGGEPAVHNDTAEEWFGFWGFKDLNDTAGYPRPVWHAVTAYNRALVASPKNQTFYQNEVPVEIFLQEDVKKLRVVYEDRIVLESDSTGKGYFSGKLSFAGEDLKDRELIFEFYDGAGRLLKIESIIVLTGKEPVPWPTLEVRTGMTDLDAGKEIGIELNLKNNSVFTLGDDVRYLFSHHIGWESGERRRWKIDPKQNQQSFRDVYQIPSRSPVVAIFAGTDIRYGKFVRTIYDQQFVYRGNWADPIRLK